MPEPSIASKEEVYVEALYVKVLQRASDSGGKEHWVAQAKKSGARIPAHGIVASTERSRLRRKRDITLAYKELLDREPDEEGLEWWFQSKYTITQIEGFIVRSQEFIDNLDKVAPPESPDELPGPPKK